MRVAYFDHATNQFCATKFVKQKCVDRGENVLIPLNVRHSTVGRDVCVSMSLLLVAQLYRGRIEGVSQVAHPNGSLQIYVHWLSNNAYNFS